MAKFNVMLIGFLFFTLGCAGLPASSDSPDYKIIIERLTKTSAVVKNVGTQTIPANGITVYVDVEEKCRIALALEPDFSGFCEWEGECKAGHVVVAKSQTHTNDALCPANS